MVDNIVNIGDKRAEKNHDIKEERQQKLKKRFESALPSDSRSPKKKLLDIFKNKKK